MATVPFSFAQVEVLGALGGLGLFLLAVSIMTDGLRELAGDSLRQWLARFTTSPWSGALTGALVTALLRSSSATTVAAVGFVGAGLLSFPQALGITFGANVGTTISGWIVALFGFKWKLGDFAWPLVLAGALLRMFGKQRLRGIGNALAGFALMFVGLELLQTGMSSSSASITPADFPPDTLLGRAQLLLIGAAVTIVTQSSTAGVATAMAALSAGTISFPQAAAMVVGMDVGTTAAAAVAALGGRPATRRTGYAHVVYNVITGFLAFWLVDPYIAALDAFAPAAIAREPEFALVGFHSGFNLIGVLLILPFTGAFARLMERLVPEREPSLTRQLDPKLLTEVGAAVEALEHTVRRVAASLFAVTARLAAGGLAGDGEASLETLQRAIDELRGFAARIGSTAGHPEWDVRLVDAMHAIDHLERLVERCAQSERPATIARDDELTRLGIELRDALMEARRALHEETLLPLERLDVGRRTLREGRHGLRSRTLVSAARKTIALEAALARLDAVRWLHRVAYHAWRIAWHLSSPAQRVASEHGDEDEERAP